MYYVFFKSLSLHSQSGNAELYNGGPRLKTRRALSIETVRTLLKEK